VRPCSSAVAEMARSIPLLLTNPGNSIKWLTLCVV
jgi:hypothetical protein